MPGATPGDFWAILQARHPAQSDPVSITLGDIIEIEGLAAWLGDALQTPNQAVGRNQGDAESLKEQAQSLEVQQIRRALEKANGNQSAAARLLRMRRSTMISKMKKYGLI